MNTETLKAYISGGFAVTGIILTVVTANQLIKSDDINIALTMIQLSGWILILTGLITCGIFIYQGMKVDRMFQDEDKVVLEYDKQIWQSYILLYINKSFKTALLVVSILIGAFTIPTVIVAGQGLSPEEWTEFLPFFQVPFILLGLMAILFIPNILAVLLNKQGIWITPTHVFTGNLHLYRGGGYGFEKIEYEKNEGFNLLKIVYSSVGKNGRFYENILIPITDEQEQTGQLDRIYTVINSF